MHWIVDETMLLWIDVGDRAAPDNVGHAVGEELSTHHKHTRGARSPNKLMWTEKYCILICQWMIRALRKHIDIHVGCSCRKIPE